MSTSDIISIGLLALVVLDIIIGVAICRPYYVLKGKYDVLCKHTLSVTQIAERHQTKSFELLDQLNKAKEDIQLLEKDVEKWKARSTS